VTDPPVAPVAVVPAAVELRGITKRFGAVTACQEVDLVVRRGEIHGLLGENGAGKTTLMRILVGQLQPDGGEIVVAGQPVAVRDPMHAASLGLAMAQQHFSLVERLRVWENVALAHRGALRRKAVLAAISDVADRYGVRVDPRARVDELSAGQRQRVELVKWLSLQPSVLVLDEPTSVLSAQESQDLFTELRRIAESATDRVTVLREGSVVAAMETADTDAPGLARAMVG
jgi:ABC-type uncharacterized transport system ATPase subunit